MGKVVSPVVEVVQVELAQELMVVMYLKVEKVLVLVAVELGDEEVTVEGD